MSGTSRQPCTCAECSGDRTALDAYDDDVTPVHSGFLMRRVRYGGEDWPGIYTDAPHVPPARARAARTVRVGSAQGATAAIVTLLLACLALTGCGASPWEVAQTTTSAIAHGVKAADAEAAVAYTERAQAALEAAESLEDYRQRMSRLDAVERALRSASRFLRAAQAGVLAWRAGDAGESWRAAMPCLALAITELVAALSEAGVPIPPEIQQGVDVVAGFLGSRCVEVTP